MHRIPLALMAALLLPFLTGSSGRADDLLSRVEHGFAENDGVKIHFVSLGDGPLMVLLHGFPDYWYTWRDQMDTLAKSHQVVAIDLRGYNKSDKPKGVQSYAMPRLVGDVACVIDHFKKEKAIVVGHDWGAAIAWQFAMQKPGQTDRLIILNVPHPAGLTRELTNNETQSNNSQYARNFQKEGAHKSLNSAGLAAWVQDAEARKHYVEAFDRSDFEAMLHYYKANYPKTSSPGSSGKKSPPPSFPKIQSPVLVIHGLEDPFLLAAGHNDTWKWIDRDMTLVMIPGAGHFVQQDASELVTKSIVAWLGR